MEITEAFHPETPIANPMGVNKVDPDPTGGRGLLPGERGNPPKRSPNCNGHPASSSIQVYRNGEISFIPLQERGIILHGKPMFILLHYSPVHKCWSKGSFYYINGNFNKCVGTRDIVPEIIGYKNP